MTTTRAVCKIVSMMVDSNSMTLRHISYQLAYLLMDKAVESSGNVEVAVSGFAIVAGRAGPWHDPGITTICLPSTRWSHF